MLEYNNSFRIHKREIINTQYFHNRSLVTNYGRQKKLISIVDLD